MASTYNESKLSFLSRFTSFTLVKRRKSSIEAREGEYKEVEMMQELRIKPFVPK